VLDPNGQPIVERSGRRSRVKTEQKEGVLSIRPNLRAFFRTSASATADVDIWKGSNLYVRSPD
jgi:hypothetical protein